MNSKFLRFFLLIGMIFSSTDLFSQKKPRRKTKKSLIIESSTSSGTAEKEKIKKKTKKDLLEDALSMSIAAYHKKKYDIALQAINNFFSLIEDSNEKNVDYARLIKAKVLFAKGNKNAAAKLLDDLELLANDNRLTEEVWFNKGVLFADRQDFLKASRYFLNVLNSSTKNSVLKKLSSIYFRVALHFLSSSRVFSFLKLARNSNDQALIIEVILSKGIPEESVITFLKQKIMMLSKQANDSNSTLRKREDFLNSLTKQMDPDVPILNVGIILPISFEMFSNSFEYNIGIQVLNGVLDAIVIRNNDPDYDQIIKPSLQLEASKKKDFTLEDNLETFVNENQIDIIFGPIYSANALVVARQCQKLGISMVTPTATDQRLKNFENCIQINPTFQARGEASANETFKLLQEFDPPLRFALIYNQSKSSMLMAKGFKDRLTRSRHVISWEVKVSDGVASLKKAIDSLDIFFDSITGYDTTYFDGIYIPIQNPTEGMILLSRLKLYSIIGQLILPGDWARKPVLNKYKELLDGSVFMTDMHVEDNLENKAISESFELRFGKKPKYFYWFGYGSFLFLSENVTKTELNLDKTYATELLKNAKPFNAHYRTLFLNKSSVSKTINAVEFIGGELKLIRFDY